LKKPNNGYLRITLKGNLQISAKTVNLNQFNGNPRNFLRRGEETLKEPPIILLKIETRQTKKTFLKFP